MKGKRTAVLLALCLAALSAPASLAAAAEQTLEGAKIYRYTCGAEVVPVIKQNPTERKPSMPGKSFLWNIASKKENGYVVKFEKPTQLSKVRAFCMYLEGKRLRLCRNWY